MNFNNNFELPINCKFCNLVFNKDRYVHTCSLSTIDNIIILYIDPAVIHLIFASGNPSL